MENPIWKNNVETNYQGIVGKLYEGPVSLWCGSFHSFSRLYNSAFQPSTISFPSKRKKSYNGSKVVPRIQQHYDNESQTSSHAH